MADIDSTPGTVGPIAEICDLARIAEHLDFEAHASGKRGDTIVDRVDIISGALGKGFGTMGGYIAGSPSVIDMIRSLSRGFIFTTAPPPATMAGAQAAIEFQRDNPQDRMELQRNVRAVKTRLRQHALPVLPNQSHIVPLMVGDSEKCKAAADILFDEFDIYVQPINTPSVAVGQERLRIPPTAAHTRAHQDQLVDALVQIWDRLGLKRTEEWTSNEDGSMIEGWEEMEALAPVWTDAQLGIKGSISHDRVQRPSCESSELYKPVDLKYLENTRLGW